MSEAIEIKDFSGGVTDYPLNASLNKYEIGNNLLLEKQATVARPVLRPGSILIGNNTTSRIPEGNQRVASLYMIDSGYLLTQTSGKIYYRIADMVSSSFTNTRADGLSSFSGTANTTLTCAKPYTTGYLFGSSSGRPVLTFRATSGPLEIKTVTAGLPKPVVVSSYPNTGDIYPKTGSSVFTAYNAGAGATVTILCSIVLRYDLYIDSKLVQKRSEPLDFIPVTMALNAGSTWGVEFKPINIRFNNASGEFFDTDNIVAEIYMTLPNGTVLYKVTEKSLSATGDPTVKDTTGETVTFLANTITPSNTSQFVQKLYTTGGVFPNSRPPTSPIIHTNGELTYYGRTDSDDTIVYQSIPNIPWGVPATFYATTPDKIMGISSAMSVTVIACKNSAYRIEGAFDLLGRGGMVLQRISDSCSCVSAPSLVQTDVGLFWAGEDGIYYTDGYRVQRINTDHDVSWRKFYQNITDFSVQNADRIQGKFDSLNRLVYWTIQKQTTSEGSTDTDALYVLDLNYPITPESTFLTWSGGEDVPDAFKAFSCTAIEFDKVTGQMFRGDSRGHIHKHVVSTHAGKTPVYTDVYYESKYDANPIFQISKSVLPTLKTIAYDFGASNLRKWVPKISFVFETNDTANPYFLDVQSINDRGRLVGLLDRIKIDSSDITDQFIFIAKWRHFPRGSLRCLYKQLKFFAPQVLLASSTVTNTATVTGSSVVAASLAWPDYVVGSGYIYFADDNYTQGYLITDVSGLVLTVSGSPPSGAGKNWRLYGNSLTQRFGLASYAVNYTLLGDKTERYSSTEATP